MYFNKSHIKQFWSSVGTKCFKIASSGPALPFFLEGMVPLRHFT